MYGSVLTDLCEYYVSSRKSFPEGKLFKFCLKNKQLIVELDDKINLLNCGYKDELIDIIDYIVLGKGDPSILISKIMDNVELLFPYSNNLIMNKKQFERYDTLLSYIIGRKTKSAINTNY